MILPNFYSDIVIEHDDHVLVASTAMIEVTAMSEPDPAWTWTDKAGHTHTAVEGEFGTVTYPTLEIVNGAYTYCPNCRDVHPDIWFECRECRDKTLPGTRPGVDRMIPGPTIYVIDDQEVTKEQADEFVASYKEECERVGKDPGDPFGLLIKIQDLTSDLPGMGDH